MGEPGQKGAGANLFEEGLIVNETPDEAALEDCRGFGGAVTVS
jgi:hypothetical protein